MNKLVTLIGDGIENPANAVLMKDAAVMFGANCKFRDTKGLNQLGASNTPSAGSFATIETNQIHGIHSRIVAFDNFPDASEVYGYQAGSDFALLVGNERRGLSYECVKISTDKVQVPMLSRRINCLNVAAASVVAFYYLCGAKVGRMAVRSDPANKRPEVLLLSPGNHVEAGSTIRSTAAFGWSRVFIEDRSQVWFGCDRAARSEGRAAARRGKNEIICIPCQDGAVHAFSRVTVITTQRAGTPMHRVNLARGSGQLVVIPDESNVALSAESCSRLGKDVEFAHLQIPVTEFSYHYRLIATIALAEISRQVGRRPATKVPPSGRPPIYDRRLAMLAETAGEAVRFEDLTNY